MEFSICRFTPIAMKFKYSNIQNNSDVEELLTKTGEKAQPGAIWGISRKQTPLRAPGWAFSPVLVNSSSTSELFLKDEATSTY
jgi:hypothetical protein